MDVWLETWCVPELPLMCHSKSAALSLIVALSRVVQESGPRRRRSGIEKS